MQRRAPREAQGCPALIVPDARQGGANPLGRERGPEPERLGGEGVKTGRTGLNSGKDLMKVEKKSMGALRCLSVCNLHGKRIKFPLFSPSCSRGVGGVGFGPGREPPT